MDAGAHGVIVPMVNSVQDAELAVAAVKYPPKGQRSFGLARAHGYGTAFKKYLEWQEERSMVVVQIEHIDAVNNMDLILAVSGVDAYFVGPDDLSGSLGIPGQFDHPEFLSAMDRIRCIGRASGKPGGKHVVEPSESELRQSIEEGNQFIAYSMDSRMLDTMCRDALGHVAEIKE
jgi:2-dehydro-3-deoxyglucarate aldolase